MIIALDYDNTYTRDPTLWDAFILFANKQGHVVLCVTSRFSQDLDEVKNAIKCLPASNIYATNLISKKTFMKSKNISVDIWIDDCPEMIVENNAFIA